MANDQHPRLGTLSEEEVRLVQKHRDGKLMLEGWRQGTQAVINAFDNNQPDGSVTLEVAMRHLREHLKHAANNPKIY